MCMLHSLRRKSHGLRAVRSSTSCGSWKSRHTLCAVCQSMEDCRYLSWDPWFTPEHRDLLEPVMCFSAELCVPFHDSEPRSPRRVRRQVARACVQRTPRTPCSAALRRSQTLLCVLFTRVGGYPRPMPQASTPPLVLLQGTLPRFQSKAGK